MCLLAHSLTYWLAHLLAYYREVLPALARSVLQLLQAGVAGKRVGGLAAATSGDAEVRADLYDLLETLVEHRVLVKM